MPGRRILIVAVLLGVATVLVLTIASGGDEQTATRPATTPGAPVEVVVATIPADVSKPQTVRAGVGDHIELDVEVAGPDSVAIADYGLVEPADATTPAHFDLFADRAGKFPVRVQSTGRQVGTISVTD